jgi:O-antigen ligase
MASSAITWLLWLLAATAPIVRSGHSATIPLAAISGLKTWGAIFLGLLVFLRQCVTREDGERFPQWLSAFLACWAAWAFLALLHSTDVTASLHYVLFTLAGLCVFWAALYLTSKEKRFLVGTALTIGGLLGALVLLQYVIVVYHVGTFLERFIVEPRTQAYFESNLAPETVGHYRPSGTMPHPNSMGLYFALLFPYAIALLGAKKVGARYRWPVFAMAGVMALGLLATDSRAAAVWVLVSLIYLGGHSGYRWLIASGISTALIGLLFLWATPSGQTLYDALHTRLRLEYGMSGRPLIWRNTLDLLREEPWLGVGPGNFSHRYVDHFGYFIPNDPNELNGQIWAIQTLGDEALQNFHAHNIYLQLAGETGIAGAALYVFGLLAVMVHCEEAARSLASGSFERAMTLATAAGAAGLMGYGIFDSQLVFTLGSLNLLAGPLLALGLKPQGRFNVQIA